MSLAVKLSPAEFRPLLHGEVEKLRDEDLPAAHRALLAMEADRLAEDLDSAFDEARAEGRLSDESVCDAIHDHRAQHPYP